LPTTGRSRHIKAWGGLVRRDILHVLLIDKGSHPLLVSLRLPTVGRASIERLIARRCARRRASPWAVSI
jgi:hypothetical protein